MSKPKTETKQETTVHVSNGADFFATLTWTGGTGAIRVDVHGTVEAVIIEPPFAPIPELTPIEAYELGVALQSAARANGYNTTRAPRKLGENR